MSIKIPSIRGSSCSIIGAISERDGLIHYEILHGSNNTDTFHDLIVALKEKIQGEVTIVMDNLSVHKSKRVKELFDDRFKQLFLPPYSCTLNPIEHLWSLMKQKWRAIVLQHNEGMDDEEID